MSFALVAMLLAGDHRSAANLARDASQHPLETLLFFGIKPEMTVVETWPGASGRPPPGNGYVAQALRQFEAKLASRPDVYRNVAVTRLGPGDFDRSIFRSGKIELSPFLTTSA